MAKVSQANYRLYQDDTSTDLGIIHDPILQVVETSKETKFNQNEKFIGKAFASGFKMRTGVTSDVLMFTNDPRTT